MSHHITSHHYRHASNKKISRVVLNALLMLLMMYYVSPVAAAVEHVVTGIDDMVELLKPFANTMTGTIQHWAIQTFWGGSLRSSPSSSGPSQFQHRSASLLLLLLDGLCELQLVRLQRAKGRSELRQWVEAQALWQLSRLRGRSRMQLRTLHLRPRGNMKKRLTDLKQRDNTRLKTLES